jgi:hypothetical protein
MSTESRYQALIESVVETAYYDELQKLGYLGVMSQVPRWAQVAIKAGKPAAAILPFLAETGVRAGGAVGRFGARQRYAMGLGVKGAKAGTPEQAARLGELAIPGAKPIDPSKIRAQAIAEEQSKLIPRIKRKIKGEKLVHGTPSTEKALAAREAKILGKQQAEAKLHELTKGTLPGTIKAMVTRPGQVMGAGWKAMSPLEKTFVGGSGVLAARDLSQLQGKTPEEKAESISRAATLAPLWIASGGMTALPSMALWMGGDELAAAGARRIGKAIGGSPEQLPEAPATEQGELQ